MEKKIPGPILDGSRQVVRISPDHPPHPHVFSFAVFTKVVQVKNVNSMGSRTIRPRAIACVLSPLRALRVKPH